MLTDQTMPPFGRISKKKTGGFSWKKSKRIRFLIYAIVGIAFYLLLIKHVLPVQYDLKVGSTSKETIFAPSTVIDKYATELARREAVKKTEPKYFRDDETINAQIEQIDHFFAQATKILSDSSLEQADKISKLKKLSSTPLLNLFYQRLLNVPSDQMQELRLITREVVFKVLNEGVQREEIQQKKQSIAKEVDIPTLTSESRYVVQELAKQSIVPTEFYDAKATAALRKTVADSVQPVLIRKGQVIVAKNDVITEDQFRKLKDLGFIHDEDTWTIYVGLGLLILFLLIMLDLYLSRFHSHLHKDLTNLIMLGSIFILTLITMNIVSLGQNLEWNTIGYLAPTAFGVMLITLLLGTDLALAGAVFLAIVASIIFNSGNYFLFDYRYGLVSLVTGVASAFSISSVRNRSKILVAGLITSISSLPVITSLYLLNPTDNGDIKSLLISLTFGAAGGIISAVLTIGCLPYFETVFDILSPIRLLELGNPNQPLLRKLLIEAPGTYHHSIVVGNLAEAAAEAIGADGLLARVGAYYHDVGKTKRPQFFIENQIYGNNPHDKISPNLSKTIILSHPRDGVKLLQEHKLPKPIQDIAAQHHGTTVVKYFYHEAKQQAEGTQILEEDFRYPGPKAQFKEAAIVGICDCVEAAVRSIARPTPSRIENLVSKIIQDRLEDGQFYECDLTFRELELIRRSICETLQGLFHSRIEYPDEGDKKGG
jgi:putative nucleotidyltransferase with HDIG domain